MTPEEFEKSTSELLAKWRDYGIALREIEADYRKAYYDALKNSQGKTDKARIAEAEAMTADLREQRKKLEHEMNCVYIQMQMQFALFGKQFVGPSFR